MIRATRTTGATLSAERLYVGGDIPRINGVARSRVACSTVSDHTVTGWAPTVNNVVHGLITTASVIYLVGEFTTITAPRVGAEPCLANSER